ncbi:MAG: methyltransferase domain-containing protein [Bacteroidales bacterium]|nr:methyltransferase domain-containing protein [Bacteroidales bacterium]
MIGTFDTDTKALTARIAANTNGSNNFDAWVLQNIAPKKGNNVLELGCGTGKQTLPIAKRILPGKITAVDISSDGEPLLQLQHPKKQVLQILMHPVWWGKKKLDERYRDDIVGMLVKGD